ncbi:MAG TPA: CPBP family intramembrane glutamic endopeptidase, partial [Gemmatimonadales bacterium]|nr:CPBP family intramembrane glutamic endopeptidase [Gemmatimonadales bacterium]
LKAIGWSVAFGVEGLVVGVVVILGLVWLLQGGVESAWFDQVGLQQAFVQGIGLTIGFGVATYHVGHGILGRSWESLRWRPSGAPGPWLARGVVLGAATGIVAMLLGLILAGANWTLGEGTWLEWSRASVTTAAALALPALSEELIFRGVPLVLLARLIGRERAVLATAAVFGLAHLANPDATGLGIANITMAGVLLGTVFYAPGGIWAAWGAHLGWNLSLAAAGAPVSGLPLPIPLVKYLPGSPDWMTGGAFGPEGGILATVAMAGAVFIAWRWIPKGASTA